MAQITAEKYRNHSGIARKKGSMKTGRAFDVPLHCVFGPRTVYWVAKRP